MGSIFYNTSSERANYMVELAGISKSFHSYKAVNDVSFTVNDGEIMVLLGTSGCGKTTTLKMINGLIQPDSGTISIGKETLTAANATRLRRKTGYVMQQNGLFPHYTVEENIGVVPTLSGWPRHRIREATYTLMERLHLSPDRFATQYPAMLSGGQQQRVGIARALVADPPLLLMDEPFGALDPVTRLQVREDFMGLEEAGARTIIMVTHDIEEAFMLGNRICLMDSGRIVQLGTPAELLFKPASDFVRTFCNPHRTLLEFRVIRIQELCPWLPDYTPDNNAATATLPATADCWQVMELLSTGTELVTTHCAGKQKMINRVNLPEAMNQYKKALQHK